MYSHDTKGLGHSRRNLLIGRALSSSPLQATVLMIAGARQMGLFPIPLGVDCMTLPGIRKNGDGQYGPASLGISLDELVALRSKTIGAALDAFDPDVLIVDYAPRGAFREMEPALEFLHAVGHTCCIFGLRDVLFDPAVVHREWSRAANLDAVRKFYDAVWIYGDPAVYDAAREYQFPPDLAAKVTYTGYLDQRKRLEPGQEHSADPMEALALPPGRLVLCLLGGGQDGERLAEVFAQVDLPPQTNGVIITGPFMAKESQQRLCLHAAGNPRLRVLEFLAEPAPLVLRADRIIAMGGYNTVCEMLSFEKRSLVVPRVNARREQIIRAERLSGLGLIDMLHPDQLSPQALRSWLLRELPPLRVGNRIDLNGLARIPGLLQELLAGHVCPKQAAHAA